MFPQSSRIKKEDMTKVIKEGVSYHSPSFSVKFLKNSVNKGLFSVVISKKTAKTAVLRSKNKRRVREAIKKCQDKISNGMFVVFIKKNTTTTPFKDLCVEIHELLARVK